MIEDQMMMIITPTVPKDPIIPMNLTITTVTEEEAEPEVEAMVEPPVGEEEEKEKTPSQMVEE